MERISLKEVNKSYQNKQILKKLTFDIQGSFGLLGPNGAGKTTLMRILTTLVPADSGEITMNDELSWNNQHVVRSYIGYLPQHFSLYKNVTVVECLLHLAVLKGIKKSKAKEEIDFLLQEVNLQEHKKKKIKQLSGGMLRRVGIAQALLGNPGLLIVDEPTVGLDIEERVRFRNLLRKLGVNRTILISTHIVEDIEMTCDYIGILKQGEIIFTGKKEELKALVAGKIKEELLTMDEADAIQDQVISLKQQEDKCLVRYFVENQEKQQATVSPTIEDAYLYLTRKGE
ncbi:putative ABC transporter ATP-binding protein YxlF [Priestia megaterium Q3]|uniref:Putative ABC transporter ATP-binding protein YxlF n=1 Tax=Priestia megaterium Q3 TaxID=1452722 RepID=A0A806TX12_PRIMG|nr:ABC transporter ATP-binding protein [Priestia megaterium]AKP75736.1 putative ABC transporter ATP-binding protein YxlF [Priestia megaterium Q3]